MFVVHLKVNGAGRFTPLCDPDEINDNFAANASGTAAPTDTVSGCLTSADAVVVIWHSDGKTHGKTPGTSA